MFLLESEDKFLIKAISQLLIQKEVLHTLDNSKKYFFTLEINQNSKNIEIKGPSKSVFIKTPSLISYIVKNILYLFNDYKININGAHFYPLKQTLIYRNKEAHLGNIHFKILSQLLLDKDYGTNKTELYQNIWPLDKDLQINRLDTHLTNLKNHLKEKINLNFQFLTRSGLIYISID